MTDDQKPITYTRANQNFRFRLSGARLHFTGLNHGLIAKSVLELDQLVTLLADVRVHMKRFEDRA